jgi:hypothetical protein
MSSGTLVVERPRAGSRDRFRSYAVMVDGSLRGTIRRGGALRIELPPGTHHVIGVIDWGSSASLDIEVTENSTARLRIEPGGSTWRVMDYLKPAGYLKLTRVTEES